MVKIQKRIPFDLCDPVGIMFYGSIYNIAHQALEEALPKIGISWDEWFFSDKGAPVRHVECNYLKPMKANQLFDVELHFENMTDSSITVHYIFKNENKIYCDLKVVKVFVERAKMQKTTMPDKFRNIFQKI